MSSIQAFAKEASTLCVGATAFVLGDPSGGTLLATPLAALGALGLTLNAGCAAKADQKARDAVLQQLGTTGAFAAEHIDRARAILKDAPATAMLDPKALAQRVHGSDLEDTLTAALLDQLAIGADDHQVRRLIETALRAGIAACKGDADFRSGLTLELILISARQQKIAIRTLGDIKQGVDDIKTVVRGSAAKLDALPGTFEESLRSFTHASRDQLEAIAARFEIAQIYDMSDAALRQALENKAADYRALRAEIAALNGVSARIDNIRGAAEAALEIPDFDQANQLLEDAREIIRDQLREPLETNATLMEKQAEIALLRGRTEQAFALLSAAADSFAGIDPLDPARRRMDYMQRLYQQGLRYGGKGLELATRMTEDALSALDRTAAPQLWANAQNNLANALQQQGTRTDGAAGAALLARAVTAYEAALEVYTRQDHPVDWAMTQNNLAIALQQQGTRTDGAPGAALLARAIKAYEAALEVRTRQDHPVDWAMTQNNLATALQQQGTRTDGAAGAALLARAVTAYEAALEVYTRQDHPVDWAMTQNNLAIALQQQGTRTDSAPGAALLARAVTAYEAALEVRTRQDHPVQWAQTQNNLAAALQQQGTRTDSAALLARAVKAYEAALEVRTRQDHPLDWAMTQNNLATALQHQGTRTGGAPGAALLARAVTAYEAALEVRTRQDHPVQWAETRENMAILEKARATQGSCPDPAAAYCAALAHVDAALTVYDPQHMPFDHAKATTLRDLILSALRALDQAP